MGEYDNDQAWGALQRYAHEILSQDKYNENIQEMLTRKQLRLAVSLDDIRQQDPTLPELIIKNPIQGDQIFAAALNDTVRSLEEIDKYEDQDYRVTFDGNFGNHHITPRGLSCQYVNHLVKVQGIVTKLSLVHPKLQKSVHYNDVLNKHHYKTYSDQYDLQAKTHSSNMFLTKDAQGNRLITEFGLCQYKDSQMLTLQELPEKSPKGVLPRSVDVILEKDLVDQVKPGDRVEVIGIYKCITNSASIRMGLFKTVIVATNIYQIGVETQVQISPLDIRHIRELSQRNDLLDLLARSLVPSIYGHENIKKSLILLLLGGVEKNLQNGTHLRGDINILLIGDPSTAKSQLLRSVMNTAFIAINTTGRGASGVGLTAAVGYDSESKERILEAGAMVLGDRGVVCIDEFDKMNEVDRVAIHEAMEQQTVTISKAGIHVSLNARCSILAAANPIYGTYQRDKSPSFNIALPDSLLSRFDLLFVVLDHQVSSIDRKISEQVILNHMIENRQTIDDMGLNNPVIEPDLEEDYIKELPIYFSWDNKELVSRSLLRKYIRYAKQIKPMLTQGAVDAISEAWTDLRQTDQADQVQKLVPVTVRTLETIIRLSTAMAKVYLSTQIEVYHVEQALELLRFAIYYGEGIQEVEEETRQTPVKRRKPRQVQVASVSPTTRKRGRRGMTEDEIITTSVSHKPVVSEDLKKFVFRVFRREIETLRSNDMQLQDIFNACHKAEPNEISSLEQLEAILSALDHENKLFYSPDNGGKAFLI